MLIHAHTLIQTVSLCEVSMSEMCIQISFSRIHKTVNFFQKNKTTLKPITFTVICISIECNENLREEPACGLDGFSASESFASKFI